VADGGRGRFEVPVEHEGIKISSVGPGDGAQIVVHPHLRKEGRVGKRLEDRAVQISAEVDLTPGFVAEPKPQRCSAYCAWKWSGWWS
jgi:hypothetical protein